MKSIFVLFLTLTIARPVFAQWVCKAYCKDPVGWLFLIERDEHPISAFEKIVAACEEATRTESALDLLFSTVDPELVSATVETACKLEDIVKY